MKTLRKTAFLFAVVGFMLTACGKDPVKQLAKTWQVTDIETATELPDSIKSQMLAGSQMVFTKDGKYTSTGGIGADQGTYTLDKEGKNLSTISQAGKSNSVYTIDKLSDEEMVLKNNGNTVTCTAQK
ncbi:lipocalin family protein [Desertivirga brevis]|uniref:lipocalin family protein n=1 Tax=Desertivirga brevis TaxID=2810310 RepID=UPI001A95D108|nr:lipocalin family protein [Pedobacter sp. SYSU D00873]